MIEKTTLRPADHEAILPAAPRPNGPSTRTALPSGTKLMLVDFRSGETVRQHPELQPLLSAGWHIRSAVPRLVESEGLKLFVVLTQGSPTPASYNRA